MKVLVFGSNGRLGQEICKSIKMNNISDIILISSTRNDFKVKSLDTIVDFIEKVSPDVIINCIANTNLIHCERNRDYAFSINANFIKYIAIASLNKKITIIHFSTEHIFDGKKENPYLEIDNANPLNVYGDSKNNGEKFLIDISERFYIFRISWLISNSGENFFTKILKRIKESDEIKVVDDQIGAPVTTEFISSIILKILNNNLSYFLPYGIYNMTPLGYVSRYDLATYILKFSIDKKIISSKNQNKIVRNSTIYIKNQVKYPLNCRLDSSKLINTIPFKINKWDYYFKSMIKKYAED